MSRPWTPDHHHADGSITRTVKQCCNGCGRVLGDVTDEEISAAIYGWPIPDVREECGCLGLPRPHHRLTAEETEWWQREHAEHPEIKADRALVAIEAVHIGQLAGVV